MINIRFKLVILINFFFCLFNIQPVSLTENTIKQELFDESMDDCIDDFDFEEAIQVYYINI